MFEDAYSMWTEGRLTQSEAARLLGVCERTFRRQVERCESDGIEGLRDRRVSRASHRAAPAALTGSRGCSRNCRNGWTPDC